METDSIHSPGLHYLIELSGVPSRLLLEADLLEFTLEGCARRGGATIVKSVVHQFSPHGLSGVIVIAESHLAIHTWPELDYAAVDLFTCGDEKVAEGVYEEIVRAFAPSEHKVKKLKRGPIVS